MRKPYLAAFALCLALVGIIYLAFGQGRPVRLIPWEEPERPAVRADARTTPLTLSGLFDVRPETGNDLRKLRNRMVRDHAAALAAWRAGRTSMRDVERMELDLLVVRHRLREIDDVALHTKIAELFEREHVRLQRLFDAGAAGPDQVTRARLFVARERNAAGLPVEGPNGEGYEQMRADYLVAVRNRHESLVDLGVGNREALSLEYETLVAEFPPTGKAAESE